MQFKGVTAMVVMDRTYIQTPQQQRDEAASQSSDRTPFSATTLSRIQVRTQF